VEIGDYTYGDILTYIQSGSVGVWKHTNQLTGSYGLTGSLTINGSTSTDLVRITQIGTGNAFVVEDSTNPDATPFVIDASGSVGIGTLTPSHPLHISSSGDQLKLSNGAASWYISAKSINDFAIVPLGTRGTLYLGGYSTQNTTTVGSNGQLTVSSSNNSAFIGAGNVGIGTSTPNAKLDVAGDIHIRYTGSNDNTLSQTNGNFGYGKITPFGSNALFTFDTYATASSSVNGYAFKYSGSATLLYISGSGNVGIGTTVPNAKLDVNGNAIITGSLNVTDGITGSLFGTASYYIETDPIFTQHSGSFATTSSNTFKSDQIISGSLTITNNLTVIGSSSIQYITSSQLDISTNIISVNTYSPSLRFGGLAVIDSGSSPQTSGSLLFDSQNNQWIFVHQDGGAAITSSVLIMGPQTINNVGNETIITTNRLTKGAGGDLGEHIGDSNITDTGTTVSINSATEVTGSLRVTGNITGSGLQITGSTTGDLVRITQTGTGHAFVVVDSVYDDTKFIIDNSGSVSIGLATGVGPTFKVYVNAANNNIGLAVGTGTTGTIAPISVRGTTQGDSTNAIIGVGGYANDGLITVGVEGIANETESGTNTLGIGGRFSSYGSGTNYSVQLRDGTEGVGKVLTSITADGKARWATPTAGTILSGSIQLTGSLAISGSVISQAGNVISSDALIQASLIYLANMC
jgi:hypothetical protein